MFILNFVFYFIWWLSVTGGMIFFNQSNDYTTFSTTCVKFYVIIKCCVIITTCGKFCVIICGVAKGGVYARSNSFPSCCDISATLSCKIRA